MKNLLLFISLFFSFSGYTQSEWQEHLSHDRLSYGHFGHFIIDNDLTLLMGNSISPMNTLETIKGNSKKEQEVIQEYFTYRSKTTRTGVDSKEILLFEAWDYDINGYGAHSIYERDNSFFNRSIGELEDNGIVIDDAFLSGGPLEPKEFISGNKRYHLDYMDQILIVDDLTSSFAYHEGLDGTMYQISNGTFLNYNGGIPGSVEIGTYDKLYNDPYSNHFVELEGNILIRHAYEDYSSQGTNELLDSPIEVQFIENGLYYLYETESMYTIAFYSYDESSSEVFYELAKTDAVEDFHINDFEVVGDEIYLLGIYKSPLNQGPFSYVQKRSLTKDFEPIRKDLELTFASVYGEPVNDYGLYNYDYKCTVTNISMDTIHHFSVYSNGVEVTIGDKFYIQKDLPVTLAPGESHEFEGKFTYYGLAYLTFHIVGVDFGLDRDISNNTYVADVTTSVKELEVNQFSVGPNPCTDLLSISGDINTIHTVTIQSMSGQQIVKKRSSNGTIDVSSLPPGHYFLHINSVYGSEVEKFIKH